MNRDIPQDYKIEHDKLVFEIAPIAKKLYELMKSLPTKGLSEEIEFYEFDLIIRCKSKDREIVEDLTGENMEDMGLGEHFER